MPDPDVALVFNGFLALSMKEKMRLVEKMNDFFDDNDRREAIRKENEDKVHDMVAEAANLVCKCCRK